MHQVKAKLVCIDKEPWERGEYVCEAQDGTPCAKVECDKSCDYGHVWAEETDLENQGDCENIGGANNG